MAVAEFVLVRRLGDRECQQLLRITRRGTGSAVRLPQAMVVLASAGGNTVPAIARVVQADEDTVRQVNHRFNEMGMTSLDPQWAGGRPCQISDDDEAFIFETANARPEALGRPFTGWSVRRLADYLTAHAARRIRIGRKRLRQILHQHKITFQRTKTWKESIDPDRDARLARIEYVTAHFPQRVFAFDEFGPLVIRPQAGAGWALHPLIGVCGKTGDRLHERLLRVHPRSPPPVAGGMSRRQNGSGSTNIFCLGNRSPLK
ncbi:helix-turn-helix domain-containing protein [Micromonospora zhanjiangensis]|uniref:helix-turn-helix domain-containing protein n=1 Tax=Micromonospora zhanjiangensis TaxID=1522057 RepID=UPI003634772D